MSIKSFYTDVKTKIIQQLIHSRDIAAISKLRKDRAEYKKYSSNWSKVNLDDYVSKFKITNETFNMTKNSRKISFWNDGRQYEIVCAVGASYFRIRTKPYVDTL